MAEYPHQHLQIPPKRRELKFKGNGRGKFNRRTDLSREQHAARLQRQMDSLEQAFLAEREIRLDADLSAEDFGLILNVKSAPGFPLKLESLEKKPSKKQEGIYLLNIRHRDNPGGIATEAAILVSACRAVSARHSKLRFRTVSSAVERLVYTQLVGSSILSPSTVLPRVPQKFCEAKSTNPVDANLQPTSMHSFKIQLMVPAWPD